MSFTLKYRLIVSGCVSSIDCKYYEECNQGKCSTIKCDPIDIIPNGVLELVHGTVMFKGQKRTTAKFSCERGYIFSDHPERKVDKVLNSNTYFR